MPLASTIKLGTLTLDGGTGGHWIENLDAEKMPGSLKSVFNQNISITEIPGRSKEWQISIKGTLQGGSMEADLDTLEGYFVGSVRQFVDGDHDGNYIIMVLNIHRTNKDKVLVTYDLILREYTQTLP